MTQTTMVEFRSTQSKRITKLKIDKQTNLNRGALVSITRLLLIVTVVFRIKTSLALVHNQKTTSIGNQRRTENEYTIHI